MKTKRLAFTILASLLMLLSSCYKDNATYTVEVTGTQPTYLVTYTDMHNILQEKQEVERGWQYYNEYETNWRLKIKVVGVGLAKDSLIKVNIYKRENLIGCIEGSKTLSVNTGIIH